MREPIPFGPYLLLERVAVGGTAEVFVAREAEPGAGPGRLVAVKRLLPHLADDPAQVERFLEEARLGGLRQDPASPRVLGHGKLGSRWFLALEWVAGPDLGRVLAHLDHAPDRFPADLAALVGLRLAEALDRLHRARGPGGEPLGLVHGDVAPANVLLGFEGEVKLGDLGLAGSAGGRSGPRGRRAWRAPELLGGGARSPASDVYAAAAVVRRLLGPPGDPPTLLDGVLARGLAADPALRPGAGDLAEALRPLAGGEVRLGAFLRERFPAELAREQERLRGT